MTRKHFEAIALILKTQREEHDAETAERIADDLAGYFAGVNPNFDRARFLKACGL